MSTNYEKQDGGFAKRFAAKRLAQPTPHNPFNKPEADPDFAQIGNSDDSTEMGDDTFGNAEEGSQMDEEANAQYDQWIEGFDGREYPTIRQAFVAGFKAAGEVVGAGSGNE